MSWQIPQGIEVLVKKASVDPDFAELLLADRAEAAREIGLELDQSETMMLRAVPAAQLEAIIAQTVVPQEHRRAFLGKAAATMLAALGATAAGLAEAGLKGFGSGGIRAEFPEPPVAKTDSFVESQVIAVVALQLRIPKQRISQETKFVEDLHADARQREAIRRALENQFDVPIPSETFQKLQRVGQVIVYIETAAAVEPRVIEVIARELRIAKEQIARDTSLVDDLKVSPGQRSRLRKELAKKFRIYIAWATFSKFRTVGEVVDYIDTAVKRREAAKAPKQPPVPPSPATRGIRPDRPASMGIRPGPPPEPKPSPWRGGAGGIRPGSNN